MEIVKKASSTPFLGKLWKILEEDNNIVGWNEDGTFSVKSKDDLEEKVLPRHFRSGQFSSFERQLNYYGFKKKSQPDDKLCWFHELFQRHSPEKVLLIKRKVNTGNEKKKRVRRARMRGDTSVPDPPVPDQGGVAAAETVVVDNNDSLYQKYESLWGGGYE